MSYPYLRAVSLLSRRIRKTTTAKGYKNVILGHAALNTHRDRVSIPYTATDRHGVPVACSDSTSV